MSPAFQCFVSTVLQDQRCVLNASRVQIGVLESSFGKSGKFKVYFRDGAVVSTGTKLTLRQRKLCKLRAKGSAGRAAGGAGGPSSK
jgi:hypothetical protein